MKRQTKALRAALRQIGITRPASVTVRTSGAITSAATLDPGDVEMIAAADQLTRDRRYGVVITRRPDGTAWQALVTTDPCHAGHVRRRTLDVPPPRATGGTLDRHHHHQHAAG